MAQGSLESFLGRKFGGRSVRRVVIWIVLFGLALRVYLGLTSFCIAADGVAYIAMARAFAVGRTHLALASVFSPLYPWLMAQLYPLLPHWELLGNLISVASGSLAIAMLYLLLRAMYCDPLLAVGGALIFAIHPAMAEYAASVRTEAGYLCLTFAELALLIRSVERGHGWTRVAGLTAAGVLGGAAYLYRAEGIGVLPLAAAFIIAAPLWGIGGLGSLSAGALSFAISFLIVASPYLIYLHDATGHWIASRELNVAASASVSEIARNKEIWQRLALSGDTSLWAPLMLDPITYLEKVAYDLAMSFYYLAQALTPALSALLVVGLWARKGSLLRTWGEALVGAVVVLYFCGFSLFNTGPRFMLHLAPYMLGLVTLGFVRVVDLAGGADGRRRLMVEAALALGLAILLMPRALMPIGYDLAALREASSSLLPVKSPITVIASDPRAAFYAHGIFVDLTLLGPGEVCRAEGTAYLVASPSDLRRFVDPTDMKCLIFKERFLRFGGGYFDLFEVGRG